MALPKELIDLVKCPKCKGRLVLEAEDAGFVCKACRLVYPIEDEIPNFVIEDARPLDAKAERG